MNPCEHWEELLSARLDGPLTQEEARQLDEHLAACPRCRRYARELEETHKALQDWGAEPPPAVSDAIFAAVRKEPRPAKRPHRVWKALAVAALLALVIWGAALQLPGSSDTAQSTASASDEAAREESAYAQESAPAEPEEQDAAAPLSQDQAEALLRDWLDREGLSLTLTSQGLSQDGSAWIFAARNPSGTTSPCFSVDRNTGKIQEIPANSPAN